MDRRRWLTFLLRRLLPIIAVVGLLLASLRLAEEVTGGGLALSQHYQWVLGAALLALLILLGLIVQRLWRLRSDIHRDAPGAQLTRRLLIMLVLLAVPPVVVVYAFSLRFLDATVDNWFSVPLESALGDALEVGRAVVDERLTRAEKSVAAEVALIGNHHDDELQRVLDDSLDALAGSEAVSLSVFDADHRVLAAASSDPRLLQAPLPDAAILLRIAGEGRYAAAEPFVDDLVLRVVLPIKARPGDQRSLQGLFLVSPRLQPLLRNIENASFQFQTFKYLRESLKLTFALILTFVLLLSVLFAMLAAFGIARRLVAPIGRLAAATRAIGAGRFDTPLPAATDDELGFLVRSFGQMTREIELASARARHSTHEINEQRAWLEALLERLSAGVLGFDPEGRLRVANPAAETILGVALGKQNGHTLAEIRRDAPQLAGFTDPLARHFREGLREWREELVVETPEGRRVLMLRGAALPGDAGYVAVFDDLTVLNRAERDAAWGEVARRLAHEVKNPLTPIQLAAERLRRRFLGRMSVDDSEILDRATRTIVSQVEALKMMVNSFGDYARPPQITTQPIALNALVDEVLDLYANDQRLTLTSDLVVDEPLVRADAVRLRQALHNLLKNALEAVGDDGKPQITVSTRSVSDGGANWVELSVADNGPGLPADFGERWYEPYTTSKIKGTGLGLAVVKKIAEEHAGSVRAETRAAGGAQFTLRLPLG